MSSYAPTPEQQEAIDLFAKGGNLVIEAGAGTGKTTTLVAIAESTDRTGSYHAFTKAIVKDSGDRLPPNVEARTMHSLAYGVIITRNPEFKERLHGSERLPRRVEADILGLRDYTTDSVTGRRRLARGYLAGYVMEGATRFAHSADPEPLAKHLPTIDVLDPVDERGWRRGPNNRALAEAHLPALRKAWADLSSKQGRLRFTHDHYLKLYQLSDPTISKDFILFDEAQDANPVMAAILDAQGDWDTQLVYVGDSAQAIFGFTGAVNAMQRLEGNRTFLTQSFRFGQDVADLANTILGELDDIELRLIGNPNVTSVVAPVTEPDCVVTRTNAKAISEALDSMAMGKRVAIADALKNQVTAFAKAAKQLQETGFTSHRELAPFDSWEEVREFVRDDLGGHELKLMVGLVEKFGPDRIIDSLKRTVSEARADIVFSTAHTAKGREWKRVRLTDDFPEPEVGKPLAADEARLLYVACTRAIEQLDITNVGYFNPTK